MDMDFLSDPIFSDLSRSDFIGGIDNEALDFGHFDPFLQVAAAVGNIDDPYNNNNTNTNSNNNTNNNNNVNNNNSNGTNATNLNEQNLLCERKNDLLSNPNDPTVTNLPIATISARVSLTTATAVAAVASTPIAVGANNQQQTPQLPESPPDSGSEPPYSPLQDVTGLTLNSRDLYNTGLTAIHHHHHHHHHQQQQQQQQQQHPHNVNDIHTQQLLTSATHFTTPQQHHNNNNNNNSNSNNNNHFSHQLHNQMHHAGDNTGHIRIKHEAGLLINPNQLATNHNNSNNNGNVMPNVNDTHIDMSAVANADGHQVLYQPNNTNLLQYESVSGNMYPAASYQNLSEPITTACMITSMSDGSRVQVIGTSPPTPQLNRASAPSTPIHQTSSRKRKMSTQLDCPDFGSIKPDPGLTLSPIRTTITAAHLHALGNVDADKLPSVTSPVSINMPNSNHDPGNTPTHSVASLSPALSTIHSNPENSLDGSNNANGAASNNGDATDPNALAPCIRFSPFQAQNWHKLCDQNLQEISVVYYRVDADKGFNFSVSDDAFVCQKKNHFQITCHARLQGEAKFVKTPSGLEKIKSFHLHFYGVKLEAPNQTIRVEQSQSDRSKKPFYPVPIDLQSHIVSKITVGRLHFSETTNNNMRKKGRPNPEQRYFQLVVGLHVHTMSGNFPVISQSSERIIVRASNPGQFESDVDLCWQRGITQDSIFHTGRVGINTDRPDESFVVHGNLKVSGHIVQPSDSRAKQEIGELDTSVQLRNLQKIRIVRYRYEPEFAIHSGLKRASESDTEEIVDTGVIAQEVREVIPDAVKEAGSIVLPNGNVIENFLLVNKDRILMENIGAVKELCKVTGSLETRIENLERMNNRLIRAKEQDSKAKRDCAGKAEAGITDGHEMCSNRNLQIVIFLLVIVMAACLAAVSTLYFIEHNKQKHNFHALDDVYLSNGHYFTQESILLSDRKFVHSNKTQWAWPNFHFLATTRAPYSTAQNNSSSRLRQALNSTETSETYTSHGRNDELAVVMEQPLVIDKPLQALKEVFRITTTSPPLRNNKTINSKNKSKWPQPQEILRAAAIVQSAPLKNQPDEKFAAIDATSSEITSKRENVININKNSSEKVADNVPLPQDFENNSIDIDAQQIAKKSSITSNKSAALRSSDDTQKTLIVETDDEDIALKLNDGIVSTSSSNSISALDNTATVNSLKLNGVESVIYKAVSPPTSNLPATTLKQKTENIGNEQIIYSVDAPTVSNKSQGILESTIDNGDGFDLQNLGSNNDSADNPLQSIFGFDFSGTINGRESTLGRRSTSHRSAEWLTRRTVQVDVFGTPIECTQLAKRDDISNCQSVCFEDTNQLPILQQHHHLSGGSEEKIKHASEQQQQSVDVLEEQENEEIEVAALNNQDVEDGEDEFEDNHHTNIKTGTLLNTQINNDTKIVTGKSSHATEAITKQITIEQQIDDKSDTLDAILAPVSLSEEHVLNVPSSNLNKIPKQSATTSLSSIETSISIESHQPPATDCWKISTFILTDTLNKSLTVEEFCPSNRKSLNSTIIIPISRFLKETNIELHLNSATPLLWAICHHQEQIKQNGKHLIVNSPTINTNSNNNHHHHHHHHHPPVSTNSIGNFLHRQQNTSILFLNIPNRGYFIKDVALRVSKDLNQLNVCEEKSHETNALLQYNFRILRDCD